MLYPRYTLKWLFHSLFFFFNSSFPYPRVAAVTDIVTAGLLSGRDPHLFLAVHRHCHLSAPHADWTVADVRYNTYSCSMTIYPVARASVDSYVQKISHTFRRSSTHNVVIQFIYYYCFYYFSYYLYSTVLINIVVSIHVCVNIIKIVFFSKPHYWWFCDF